MMRLGFSTNAFKKTTMEDSIDTIALIGYGGVELMADKPHALPADMPADRIARVRKQLSDRRLAVTNINAFTLFACGDTYHPTWIEDDPALRKVRIDHTIAAIKLTAAVGARTVSLQPGGPLIGTTLDQKTAAERFAEGLSAVLPAARQHNVILGSVPEPGLLIQCADEYLSFKQTFFRDEPLVKMNCDIGHLFCVGDEPADVIRRWPEHIAHVHLEDIGKNRVHQHLTPGKGVIDFASVFAALDNVRYDGWVTVELYPYETSAAGVARAAMEHLRPLADTAGIV